MLTSFHFIRPIWLFLLPLAGALWWWQRMRRDPLGGWRAVMQRDLLKAMTVGRQAGVSVNELRLLVFWMLGIFALAGPTWKPEPSPFADDPVPVMVLLKANETMQLTDFVPDRMERAKLKVIDFSRQRKGLPLGLIAYAGSSHLVLPPTRDTAVVASMVNEITPEILPVPGDNLGEALALAARTLGPDGGSVVVVADSVGGLSNGQLEAIKATSISVHLLAIARDDTPELDGIREVARQLRGRVTIMTADLSDVETLARATSRLNANPGPAASGTRWAEMGWWIVPLLALLYLFEFQPVERLR